MTFCDNLLKSFIENLKQLRKMNDFLLFLRFMKTVLFCTVFIADMNSAGKNTLVSVYLLNFHRRHNSADFLQNLKISNFALFVFFSI